MSERPSAIMSGAVERIIESPSPTEPDKAQIIVLEADHLHRAIRIDNKLTNEKGEEVSLRLGEKVKLTLQAEADSTIPDK
jgi:hypothetical protein